jgi:uncharacterized protein YjbI with pentapeptide repeats
MMSLSSTLPLRNALEHIRPQGLYTPLADKAAVETRLVQLKKPLTGEEAHLLQAKMPSGFYVTPTTPLAAVLQGFKHLAGALFSGMDLTHVDFSGANLTGAELFSANMRCANLQDATLNKAMLNDSNLSHANLSQAKLNGTNAIKANFANAVFQNATIDEANFTRTKLQHANFNHAKISHSDFNHSVHQATKFHQAQLSKVNLTHAMVNNDFTQATLNQVAFDYATLQNNRFNQATLNGCTLNWVNGHVVPRKRLEIHNNFQQARIKDTMASGTLLPKSNLTGASLDLNGYGADFTNSLLDGTYITPRTEANHFFDAPSMYQATA